MSSLEFENELLMLETTEILKLFSTKKLSPLEYFKISYKQSYRVNGILNNFSLLDEETGIVMAKASENRWFKSEPIGSIDGLPVVIKDTDDVAGWQTKKGSKNLENIAKAEDDGPSVARLREKGAVFFGKTTTPEYAWKGTTDSPLTGITRNPWNKSLTSGGSSGGSAVAIATGCAKLATATDGGGSARIPASFCGVYGFKPTPGVVPRPSSLWIGDMSVHGAIAGSTLDIAMMLDVITAPDKVYGESKIKYFNWQHNTIKGIKGFKIAIGNNMDLIEVDSIISKAVSNSAKLLYRTGAEIQESEPKLSIHTLLNIFEKIWCKGLYNALDNSFGFKDNGLTDKGLLNCVNKSLSFTESDYIEAKIQKRNVIDLMEKFFLKYNILILPTVAILPFDVSSNVPHKRAFKEWHEWAPLTWIFNITNQPSLSIPVGFSQSGLPIGMQIIGRPFDDIKVLRVGYMLEKIINLRKKSTFFM